MHDDVVEAVTVQVRERQSAVIVDGDLAFGVRYIVVLLDSTLLRDVLEEWLVGYVLLDQ